MFRYKRLPSLTALPLPPPCRLHPDSGGFDTRDPALRATFRFILLGLRRIAMPDNRHLKLAIIHRGANVQVHLPTPTALAHALHPQVAQFPGSVLA